MNSALEKLSPEQKELAIKILKEFANDGNSHTYAELIYADYKEIPVDIETFLKDGKYLGNAWKDAEGNFKLYPFWLEVLKDIFPNNVDTNYDVLLESGARGIGKSEVACGCIGSYLMYRVMCLKNPLEHYHIKNTEKIAFAFMNIKLDLAKAIAMDKFQKTIQRSPWFMSKGTITQKDNQPYWNPPDPLEIIIGSQSDDVIGRPIFFCLDGDTLIKTTNGIERLDTLVNKDIQVVSIDEHGKEVISEYCTVKPTLKTNEEYQIELEDGSIIKCTPTHRFMLKNGTYKMAKDLTEDDELFDESKSGSNNSMYGHGERISGGKNGHAIYTYTYCGIDYCCRDDLIVELKKEFPTISESAIRRIMRGKYTQRISNRYQFVIDNLTWRLKKDENQIN